MIELLVVITIIVVLLALLTPALDRAIYQAELTVCSSHLDAVATGVSLYAAEHRRYYPYRPHVENLAMRPPELYTPDGGGYDIRPRMRRYIGINAALNCPLTEEINLDTPDPGSYVHSPYNLWFGWRFRSAAGTEGTMRRMGDRFGYGGRRYQLLASDVDWHYPDRPQDVSTHPDRDGVMSDEVYDAEELVEVAGVGIIGKQTFSWWHTQDATERGVIDTNHAYADGSVARFMDLEPRGRDERMATVPQYNNEDSPNPSWVSYIPTR